MNLLDKYLIKFKQNEKKYPMESFSKNSKSLFEEKFNTLADLLKSYSLTDSEIKAQRPELHEQLQEAISAMDSAWLKEDLPEFSNAVRTIEDAYFKAMREIPEW